MAMNKKSSTPNKTIDVNNFTIDVSSIQTCNSTVKRAEYGKTPKSAPIPARRQLNLQNNNDSRVKEMERFFMYSDYTLASFVEMMSKNLSEKLDKENMELMFCMHNQLKEKSRHLAELQSQLSDIESEKVLKECMSVVDDVTPKIKSSAEPLVKTGSIIGKEVCKTLSIVPNHNVILPDKESDRELLESNLNTLGNLCDSIVKKISSGPNREVLPRLQKINKFAQDMPSIVEKYSSLDNIIDICEEEGLNKFVTNSYSRLKEAES